MSLILNLPPDLEESVKRRAADAGLDVSAYVTWMLRGQDIDELDVPQLSPEEFEAHLQRLAELHADAPANFDDSRESIYEGRGE